MKSQCYSHVIQQNPQHAVFDARYRTVEHLSVFYYLSSGYNLDEIHQHDHDTNNDYLGPALLVDSIITHCQRLAAAFSLTDRSGPAFILPPRRMRPLPISPDTAL